MPFTIDPAGKELQMLKQAADFKSKRLLEIGSGEGRLTLRLASLGPRRIDALETDRARLRTARRQLPARWKGLIHYEVGQAEHLRKSDGSYDIVVFSWSL